MSLPGRYRAGDDIRVIIADGVDRLDIPIMLLAVQDRARRTWYAQITVGPRLGERIVVDERWIIHADHVDLCREVEAAIPGILLTLY